MTDITKENPALLEKLRKIEALAADAKTDAEAQAAMLAYQRILSKHGLTADEVKVRIEDETVVKKASYAIDGQMQHWIISLHQAIALHFRCFGILTNGMDNYGLRALAFVGLADDVTIAISAFNSAKEAAERLCSRFVEQVEHFTRGAHVRTIKNSFYQGFIVGLHQAYQRQEADKTLAIIIAMPDAVRNEQSKYRKHSMHDSSNIDMQSVRAGIVAGENHGYGNRIGH